MRQVEALGAEKRGLQQQLEQWLRVELIPIIINQRLTGTAILCPLLVLLQGMLCYCCFCAIRGIDDNA